jgi:hypothetical protein
MLTLEQIEAQIAALNTARSTLLQSTQFTKRNAVESDDAPPTGSYWNGDGRLQTEYDLLSDTLVPHSGRAKTLNGELIRAIGRLGHEYFNNGNMNAWCENWKTEFPHVHPFFHRFLRLIDETVPAAKNHCQNVARIIAKAYDSEDREDTEDNDYGSSDYSDDDSDDDVAAKEAAKKGIKEASEAARKAAKKAAATKRHEAYFSDSNGECYDDLCTVVIEHVHKTSDTTEFPAWYAKE